MPKIVDHAARRGEIAAAAADAVDALGLDRVRLVDVARRAACTTGAVSHYFPDKDAVLAAALEHVLASMTGSAATGSVVAGADPADVTLERLARILPVDETRRRDWRVWLAFCGRAVHAPALASLHRDAYAEIQHRLAEALLHAGLARSDADAQQLAVSVVAALDGIGLRAVLEPDEWPAARQRAVLAHQITPLLRSAQGAAPAASRIHPKEIPA